MRLTSEREKEIRKFVTLLTDLKPDNPYIENAIYDLLAEIDALRKENQEFKEANDILKEQMGVYLRPLNIKAPGPP